MNFNSINGSPMENIAAVPDKSEHAENLGGPDWNGSLPNRDHDLEMATKLACRVEAVERQAVLKNASLSTELIRSTTEQMKNLRIDFNTGEQFPLADSIRYILYYTHLFLLNNPMRDCATAQGLAKNKAFTKFLVTISDAADGKEGHTDQETKNAIYSLALMLCQLIVGRIKYYRKHYFLFIDRVNVQLFTKDELLPLLSDEVIDKNLQKKFLDNAEVQRMVHSTGVFGVQNIHTIFLALRNLLTIAAECVVVDPNHSDKIGKNRAAINGDGQLRSGLLPKPDTGPINAADEESDFEADSFL